MHKVRMTLIGD